MNPLKTSLLCMPLCVSFGFKQGPLAALLPHPQWSLSPIASTASDSEPTNRLRKTWGGVESWWLRYQARQNLALKDFFARSHGLFIHPVKGLPAALRIKGKTPGQTTILQVALHGDEYAGVIAARDIVRVLHHLPYLRQKKGDVVIILGNPLAFLRGERYLDQNLNRVFFPLKDLSGKQGYEYDRAAEIMSFYQTEWEKSGIKLLVDIHQMTSSPQSYPIIIPLVPASVNFARQLWYGKSFSLTEPKMAEGFAVHYIQKYLNVPAFVAETGRVDKTTTYQRSLGLIWRSLHSDAMREYPQFESNDAIELRIFRGPIKLKKMTSTMVIAQDIQVGKKVAANGTIAFDAEDPANRLICQPRGNDDFCTVFMPNINVMLSHIGDHLQEWIQERKSIPADSDAGFWGTTKICPAWQLETCIRNEIATL